MIEKQNKTLEEKTELIAKWDKLRSEGMPVPEALQELGFRNRNQVSNWKTQIKEAREKDTHHIVVHSPADREEKRQVVQSPTKSFFSRSMKGVKIYSWNGVVSYVKSSKPLKVDVLERFIFAVTHKAELSYKPSIKREIDAAYSEMEKREKEKAQEKAGIQFPRRKKETRITLRK